MAGKPASSGLPLRIADYLGVGCWHVWFRRGTAIKRSPPAAAVAAKADAGGFASQVESTEGVPIRGVAVTIEISGKIGFSKTNLDR